MGDPDYTAKTLWFDVFLTCLRQGATVAECGEAANRAVDMYNTKFNGEQNND